MIRWELVVLVIGYAGAVHLAHNQLTTPCPDIFQYYVENHEVKYGMLRVKCPEETTIKLNVEISVGNSVQGYNGDLELANSRQQTIDDILNRRPINYKLYFPAWINITPKVTKIVLNGDTICAGPPIDIKTVRVLTTINLQHTLKLNMDPNSGGVPILPQGNPSVPEVEYSRPSIPSIPQSFIPNVVPPEKRVDNKPNPINFHPSVKPGINFNPVTPEDPTKIYPGNPFIPNTIVTPTRFETTTPYPVEAYIEHDELFEFGVNTGICGRSVATNSLIANGESVSKGAYPWLVAIFLIKSLGPEFLCGGNLISKRHVITAAHCMKISNRILHVDKIFLRFGAHNIHQWTQVSESRSLSAARISVHPDYKSMSADADISVITLNDDLEFTKLIRPVCLWAANDELRRIVGRVGTVVGWGKDESNTVITPEPKRVNFPVVSQEDCLRSHFTFREITSERTFCAGFRNGSGPCNGDSGGGFLLERDGQWTLRGIVSMSIAKDRGCDFSEYFVFTDIPKFMDWILDALRAS